MKHTYGMTDLCEWEYKVMSCEVKYTSKVENQLNMYAKKGWELVSVIPFPLGSDLVYHYFKRPIEHQGKHED